ncbi:fimbriae assembly protein [Aliidongia dinghuensis]|uniref:Fimbriae assembly protein n=1 Tax=Aliidongia dinghuensis TaxID=1867774 RepID=A0A8J3E3L3_9PROT|nr:cellulose synthase operon protein YhjQ/BcsQ [Aliidongia dinghuensis]GGF19619.1 fimbriae assembly protein [Aliidongia dinghuensis]
MQIAAERKELEDSAARERFAAFVTDEASIELIRQCAGDMGLPANAVHRGDIGAAIAYLEKTRSPKSLIVDLTGAEPALTRIQQLAEVCEPGVSVVAIGDRNDVGLYRDLLGVGISDYIVKPIPLVLLQKAMNGLLGIADVGHTPLGQKLGKVISVVGMRGGVGASMLATNLAWGFANKRHRRVALVDLDLKFGACGLMLGVKAESGLREALERPVRVDEQFIQRATIQCGDRLSLLTCLESVNDPITVDPAALPRLVDLLRREFHYVVLDAPRGNSAMLAQALELASARVLVVDQTTHAIRDTLALRKSYNLTQDDGRNLMVLNRFGESGKVGIPTKEMEEVLRARFDTIVPFDAKSVMFAANAGIPLLTRRGPAAKAIEQLAEKLGGQAPQQRRPWWRLFGK